MRNTMSWALLASAPLLGAGCALGGEEPCEGEAADEDSCVAVQQDALKPQKTYQVKFRKDPREHGTYGVRPGPGVTCDGYPDDVACTVPRDGMVEFIAYSSEGYLFDGWTGCSKSESHTLTLSAVRKNMTCVANFVPAPTVQVIASTNRYQVNASIFLPDGTYCGPYSCYVPVGGSLTIEAPMGSTTRPFLGWSGCSESPEPVLVLSNITQQLPTCLANFGFEGLSLTWSVQGDPPGGQVVVSYPGSRTNECSRTSCEVSPGSRVILNAYPDEGYRFVQWSGCTSDRALSDTTIGVLVEADTHCVAQFEPIPPAP